MGLINKIKKSISNLGKTKPRFDPSTLNDEIALKTKWNPAKLGGTNIGTHSLKKTSPDRIEFKVSAMGLIFPSIFMAIGIGTIILMVTAGIQQQNMQFLYFGIPFGSLFFLVGFFILRSWTTPRIFDVNSSYYWKGRKNPIHTYPQGNKDQCQLKEIHAIQLLQEFCSGSKNNSYYSYELNLVLKDANRLNVIDHGKLSLILADAEKLAQFLNVPIWNAISH